MDHPSSDIGAIKIGISTCLLGQPVRYDGGHKHDRFLTDTLGAFVTLVPVCPEVECGLGVPREAMRLVGDPHNPRLRTIRSNLDLTSRMQDWAATRVRELEQEHLCGFIFKSKSPSSGMQRVKVYSETTGIPAQNGVGLFAAAFMRHFPLVPVEEEGRLHDPILRENFIEQIFACKRWRDLCAQRRRIGSLVRFHTTHKLQIMSHSLRHYRELGTTVAHAKMLGVETAYERYEHLFMEALRLKTTVKKHTNVLMHGMGFFKKDLTPDEKQELLDIITRYHDGYIPLIVPHTMLNHYTRKYAQSYLAQQTYLQPHPAELKLRNHV